MPDKSNNTRSNTNNSVRTNNSTKRRRRGAITPNNARRIRGQFQKPPRHPVAKPKPQSQSQSRPRVLSINNINIGNLSVEEMNAILNRMG